MVASVVRNNYEASRKRGSTQAPSSPGVISDALSERRVDPSIRFHRINVSGHCWKDGLPVLASSLVNSVIF